MHNNPRVMRRDMLRCLEKAFADPACPHRELRRRAYGNLHLTIAGSFYFVGAYAECARHLAKGLWLSPRGIGHVLGYVQRRRLGLQPGDRTLGYRASGGS
jgi:hypothetical protein